MHVTCIDLQLVVIISGGVEAFHYFVDLRNDRGEALTEFLAVLLQAHIS